jgi:peptidoglycan/LPS O-acetylase OafA/YrhL
MNPDKTSRSPHLAYLDSLRGIAALMVVVYHFINWTHSEELWAKGGSILFNGSDAVSFFFVLSGFVLSYRYLVLKKDLDIGKFYVSRFFRLWPAFFITILLNALYWHRSDLGPEALKNILLLNETKFWNDASLIRFNNNYFTPGWTLAVELSLSFFVPFAIAVAHFNRKLLSWFILAVLLMGNGTISLFHFHFLLGVWISAHFLEVNQDYAPKKWYRYRHILLIAAVVLFSIRQIDHISQLGPSYKDLAAFLGIVFFHYTALASFIFLLLVISSQRAQKMLSAPVLVFLGRISYGVYLMHWLFVIAIFDYWDRLITVFPNYVSGFIVLLVVCIALTIAAATLLHYAIELPFISLGKKLAARMKETCVIKGTHDIV